ncbi:hypothetical protein H2248_000614 [Termitomyces sp. 'cryptogamus']|nr:hypothetical protein H2248_000614 [Termitomyces sp. 'cryptogamus']
MSGPQSVPSLRNLLQHPTPSFSLAGPSPGPPESGGPLPEGGNAPQPEKGSPLSGPPPPPPGPWGLQCGIEKGEDTGSLSSDPHPDSPWLGALTSPSISISKRGARILLLLLNWLGLFWWNIPFQPCIIGGIPLDHHPLIVHVGLSKVLHVPIAKLL